MNYNSVPDDEVIKRTAEALISNNIRVEVVSNKQEAFELIQKLIPAESSVMTGSSTTLDQIGFSELLKSGHHPWKNLKAAIASETDPEAQAILRKESVLADYFLGSAHAITEDGKLAFASATGSQFPAYAHTSDNVIWVVGAQKITPNVDEAWKRIEMHVFPLEDARMKSTGAAGSVLGMRLLIEKSILPNRNLTVILVKEVLGF